MEYSGEVLQLTTPLPVLQDLQDQLIAKYKVVSIGSGNPLMPQLADLHVRLRRISASLFG